MKRRSFFKNSSLTLLGTALLGKGAAATTAAGHLPKRQAKNIIFMVSDGMSTGTLNLADMYLYRKFGKRSAWLQLYDEGKINRALMDTASASSMVTDSAAGSSSWGGGVRVPNGSLNVNADGSFNKPILQKFKSAGKSVGCVTTVPIAHATPAGFCVNSKSRGDMDEIALQYLSLRFDVMMGGGKDNFTADARKDKQDVLANFRKNNFAVVTSRKEMMQLPSSDMPLLGIFYNGGLPYLLDRAQDQTLSETIPTLAEMTKKAIERLSKNKNGFVLQVESGKVDWAAHANDAAALIHEQIAFDEALQSVMTFAEKDGNTLVIITTDHGNANPGLFYGSKADKNFDRMHTFRHTNDWILNGINNEYSNQQVRERIEHAQSWAPSEDEAKELLKHYQQLDETGLYNPRKLPFKYLAQIQEKYTSIGWGSMDHSGDYVELAMYGPGSELLKPFVKNHELHNLMLKAAAVSRS
ncbi:MAG: alkaline phosphatase [Niabella sp.]